MHLKAILSAIFPIAWQDTKRTIRQQTRTREQICTWESFGQKYQNFLKYRFVPRYMIVRIYGSQNQLYYALQWRKCYARQPLLSADSAQASHVVRASIAQAFVFG